MTSTEPMLKDAIAKVKENVTYLINHAKAHDANATLISVHELQHIEAALETASAREDEALAGLRAKVEARDEEWIGREWVLAEIDAERKPKESS